MKRRKLSILLILLLLVSSGAWACTGREVLLDHSDPHFSRTGQMMLGERYAFCYFDMMGIDYDPTPYEPGDNSSGSYPGTIGDMNPDPQPW